MVGMICLLNNICREEDRRRVCVGGGGWVGWRGYHVLSPATRGGRGRSVLLAKLVELSRY